MNDFFVVFRYLIVVMISSIALKSHAVDIEKCSSLYIDALNKGVPSEEVEVGSTAIVMGGVFVVPPGFHIDSWDAVSGFLLRRYNGDVITSIMLGNVSYDGGTFDEVLSDNIDDLCALTDQHYIRFEPEESRIDGFFTVTLLDSKQYIWISTNRKDKLLEIVSWWYKDWHNPFSRD